MKRWNNIQIRISILSMLLLLSAGISYAQEEEEEDRPVRSPWTTGVLIDNQTTLTQTAKSFEFRIHHRFGAIKEMSDLFGIYAASNIRLGVNYGITDKLMIGFGTEKYNKMQEFCVKYNIFPQTRSGKMPVALTYFANAVIDARSEELFGKDYSFSKRMSYFHQLMIARKFSKKISLQTAVSYSHFNAVDSTWQNDYVGIFIGGRFNVYNKMSIIFEYTQPFSVKEVEDYQNEPKPNLGLGLEFGTSTHAFQVFAAQYDNIIAQKNLAYNLNDMGDGGWRFGFNITARF